MFFTWGYIVKLVKNKKVLDECKIGEKTLNALPKIKVGDKVIKPALVRTDFTCCKGTKHFHQVITF